MRKRGLTAVIVAAVLSAPVIATAHPDHGGSLGERFPGEGVGLEQQQHGGEGGHLPPVQENVTLVGKAEVTNPSGAGNAGRVADVFGHGDFACLTASCDPTCEQAGVHVIDISDPANPVEVTAAFIPTSTGSYAGEGIQVIEIDNEFFSGDLLLHNNETCPGGNPAPPAPHLVASRSGT